MENVIGAGTLPWKPMGWASVLPASVRHRLLGPLELIGLIVSLRSCEVKSLPREKIRSSAFAYRIALKDRTIDAR